MVLANLDISISGTHQNIGLNPDDNNPYNQLGPISGHIDSSHQGGSHHINVDSHLGNGHHHVNISDNVIAQQITTPTHLPINIPDHLVHPQQPPRPIFPINPSVSVDAHVGNNERPPPNHGQQTPTYIVRPDRPAPPPSSYSSGGDTEPIPGSPGTAIGVYPPQSTDPLDYPFFDPSIAISKWPFYVLPFPFVAGPNPGISGFGNPQLVQQGQHGQHQQQSNVPCNCDKDNNRNGANRPQYPTSNEVANQNVPHIHPSYPQRPQQQPNPQQPFPTAFGVIGFIPIVFLCNNTNGLNGNLESINQLLQQFQRPLTLPCNTCNNNNNPQSPILNTGLNVDASLNRRHSRRSKPRPYHRSNNVPPQNPDALL